MSHADLLNPVYVALDTPNLKQAEKLASTLQPYVGGIKLGLEFFMAHGRYGVEAIADKGLPIFLDLKFHDIPNTVASAVKAFFQASSCAPAIMTVHAAGGEAMMRAAKQAADKGTKIVGVTILTSLDQSDLGAIGMTGTPSSQVAKLANLARRAGLDGIVCSGAEVEEVYK
ncbi:MAG: orotidine-5'-phosphate decarboxylase, partial [Zymomonas mobilis subsp. pomaceae]